MITSSRSVLHYYKVLCRLLSAGQPHQKHGEGNVRPVREEWKAQGLVSESTEGKSSQDVLEKPRLEQWKAVESEHVDSWGGTRESSNRVGLMSGLHICIHAYNILITIYVNT